MQSEASAISARVLPQQDEAVVHPDDARQMGENGRRAVLERYNWSVEEAKLLAFYKDILQPLSATNIAALFVIQFIYGWNQYLWPL